MRPVRKVDLFLLHKEFDKLRTTLGDEGFVIFECGTAERATPRLAAASMVRIVPESYQRENGGPEFMALPH